MNRPSRFLGALAFLCTALLARAIIHPDLQLQLGNPSGATADPTNRNRYLIQRAQYALDFSDNNGDPNWVSWDLTAADVGASGRSDFQPDPGLPAGFTAVVTGDYTGSGFDRGHMCPSADRTVTTADNQIVFYMTNIVPQAPDNNQGPWASFETYCRALASAGNELLIICGPSGFAGQRIPSGKAAIPGHTWKIAVVVPAGAGTAQSRIDANTRVIAIKLPNIAGIRSAPWQNYLTSAAQIERDTGYTFFTALPGAVAAALRAKVDAPGATGAPTIVTQPAPQSAPVGGSASFTVAATGNPPLTYQWFKDDVELAGATNATLAFASVQASDAASYTVAVGNAVGATASASAALIVTGLPPVIVTPPAARAASAGTTATFSVVVAGTPPFTYQWRRGTANLTDSASVSGANTATLTLANVQAATAATDYHVVVANSLNSVTSAHAALTVNAAAPTIATPPTSQTIAVGGTATLSVGAYGTEPLGYQWRKDGAPLANGGNVAGATSATLTIANAQVADRGSYDVVVSNSVGPQATSPAATLTVSDAPPTSTIHWDFAAATPTSGRPADVTGGTVSQHNNNGTTALLTSTSASGGYAGASGGNNAGAAARIGPLNTAAAGSAYFEFTLTPAAGRQLVTTAFTFASRSTGTGPQAFDLYSSVDGFAARLATGPLQNDSTWRLLAPTFAPVAGATGAAVTYRLFGYNGAGSPGAGTANWRIDDLQVSVSVLTAPSITRQPSSQTAAVGGTVVFAVAATGTPAPTFQWRKDGANLPGQTGATLTLGNLTPADAGTYDVVARNSAGAATSAGAVLRVGGHGLAGTYFGTMTGAGNFALHVREDGTGEFLGFRVDVAPRGPPPSPDIVFRRNESFLSRNFTVGADGQFRFAVSTATSSAGRNASPSTPSRAAALDDIVFVGAIASDGRITAMSVAGSAITLAGTRTATGGATAALAGFYSAYAAGSAAQTLAIVGTSGEALLVVQTASQVDGGLGAVTLSGAISARTADAQTVSGNISRDASLALTIVDPGGRSMSFTGVAEHAPARAAQRLLNLSTRARVAVADAVIAGFVLAGDQPKEILVRAVGPTLGTLGVPGALAAPRLELIRDGVSLGANAGWTTAANAAALAAAATRAGAFALAAASADSALLVTLPPGTYSAVVTAGNNQPGVGLIEVYDLSAPAAGQKLLNLSTRGSAGTGADALIAGLVIGGTVPRRVLIRAAGPALAQFGVSGFLARPQLGLFSGSTVVAQNAGWQTAGNAVAIAEAAALTGAFAFAPTEADSALLINLAPGNYTAQITGAGETTGIALVEIYEVP